MAADGGQRFIGRNRPPRVHITYEDPYDAEQKHELPFVMGVMADLSGDSAGVEKPLIADRKFLDIDMDNFDDRMANAVQPGISFNVPDKLSKEKDARLGVKLDFRKMEDFSPAAVVRQVPSLARLLEARQRLSNLQRYMDGKAGAERELKRLLDDPKLMAALRELGPSAEALSTALKDAEKADQETEQ